MPPLDEAYPVRLWLGVMAALLGSLQSGGSISSHPFHSEAHLVDSTSNDRSNDPAAPLGYAVAVLNTALEHISTSGYKYSSGSVLASPILLGAAVGAASAGWIANKYGPRSAQLLNVLFFVLGTVLSALPWWGHHHGLVVGRAISGLGE